MADDGGTDPVLGLPSDQAQRLSRWTVYCAEDIEVALGWLAYRGHAADRAAQFVIDCNDNSMTPHAMIFAARAPRKPSEEWA